MMHDKNRLFDGFDSLEDGVDGGRRANSIGTTQAYEGENIVFRGGTPQTRPAFRKLTHNYTNPLSSYNPNGSYAGPDVVVGGEEAINRFKDGVFQCACAFSPRRQGDPESLIALVDGRLFKLVPRDSTVDITEIVLPFRNRKRIPRGHVLQADRFVIGQDGESSAIIYDGSTARRAGPTEVPVCDFMAYGMGRLVCIRLNKDILFGDIYGGDADAADPGDNILNFTETTYLNEGFAASLPFALGKPTGAAFFPQQDTSTGMGELMVFAEHGAASFFLSLPREQWKDSLFQKLALLNTGLRGWRGITSVNEDLWFRADDGTRSFRQARSEASGWPHLPISTNVRKFMDADTQELLDFASSILFENYLIQTCTPIWNGGRPYHNGFVSLDFDVLSSFGSSRRPAWNGHWSNLKTTQLVTGSFGGRKRAFVFGLDENNQNQLYEISMTDIDDHDGKIDCTLDTRAFDFASDQKSSPFEEKELYDCDAWINYVKSHDMTMQAFYKPDDYPEWLPWRPKANATCPLPVVEPIGECGEITCGGCPTIRPGFYPRMSFGKPDDKCDPTTKRNLRRGFEFQVRLKWNGRAAIQRMRVHAQQLTESSLANG